MVKNRSFLKFIIGTVVIGAFLGYGFYAAMYKTESGGQQYFSRQKGYYVPIIEYKYIDWSGEIMSVITVNELKKIITIKATENEIKEARFKYPDDVLTAETSRDGFLSGELRARKIAEEHSALTTRPSDFYRLPDSPHPPIQFQGQGKLWKNSWDRGYSYNYRRYYDWYKRNKAQNEARDNLEHEKKLSKENQSIPFSKPDYDSDWLLYDPGEYKVLTHDLNTQTDKVLVDLSLKTKGNHTSSVFSDPYQYTGAIWSEFTPSTIRIQRLYKDKWIEAIRVRIWMVK